MRALVGAAAVTAAALGGMTWAVRGRSSQVFGPSVWRGNPVGKAIALTFDDGPSNATPAILDVLAGYGVAATFFQCGRNVERTPELARAVCDGPHEIGNHSFSHPNFALARPTFIRDEFQRAQDAIVEATSRKPALTRPPYGVRWFGFRDMQRELGLTCVMWTVIGCDWRLPAPQITARVLAGAGPGAIVCLHDGQATLPNPDRSQTIEAVRRIVPSLLEKGYHFETVSTLLCRN
jgi:peptidoglycan/xylan/chitin deacetylase (PgdA/CDA1 family)